MRTTRPLAAIAAAVAIAGTVALTGCGGAPPTDVISVSAAGCGASWHVTGPGWHTFQLRNAGIQGVELDLINPATGGIYGEIEPFGPDTTTSMRVNLGSGAYAFRCVWEDADPATGPTVTVAGHATGSPPVKPVSYTDLIPAAKAYQVYVTHGLDTLAAQVATLAGDVRRGDLGAAKSAWLPAHLTYQRLGAAYGTFGDYDGEIDGRADAIGVNSPKWMGFYRLEYGLWHGQNAKRLTPVADALNSDAHALRKAWPTMQVNQLDIGLRTHEILENALQFQLTGHDDYGSGSTLATTGANIAGTRELLTLLRPLLVPRYTGLAEVYSWLDRLQQLIDQQHLQNGKWVPVSSLPDTGRQRIDAACDQALQELAPIASITEPRNT
jgi:iron uptake system component EfeO